MPTTATQTASRSETTIARIRSAAATLFVDKSYADVTMDGIARHGKVTKGALYHHFASKEELYLAMMYADLEEKKTLFEAAIARGSTARERLGFLTDAFLSLPRRNRRVMRLVRRDINVFRKPIRLALIRAYQAALPEPIERVLAGGIESGELAPADPRLLSWYFVSLVEVTLSRYADTVFSDQERKLDGVLDLFFRGAAANGRESIA